MRRIVMIAAMMPLFSAPAVAQCVVCDPNYEQKRAQEDMRYDAARSRLDLESQLREQQEQTQHQFQMLQRDIEINRPYVPTHRSLHDNY